MYVVSDRDCGRRTLESSDISPEMRRETASVENLFRSQSISCYSIQFGGPIYRRLIDSAVDPKKPRSGETTVT